MAGLTTHDVTARARQRIAQLTRQRGTRENTDGKESSILDALDGLGEGWERIDDIQWPGYEFANVDHVLVGPAGVIVIDLQRGTGVVDLDASALRRDARSPKTAVEDVVAAAHAVGSLLGMVHRRPMAVLCLLDQPNVETTVGDALICSIGGLVPRLRGMAPILDAAQVHDVAEKLRKDLVLVTGRLAAVPSQRSWAPDPGSVFELESLDSSTGSSKRRSAALVAAAAITVGVAGYAVVHIDDAFQSPGTTHHQGPATHSKSGNN